MIKGNVHSFYPFGTVDGPGIRFVLFMQGCNLNCLYCHNKDATINVINKLFTSDEIVNEVLKYQSFYSNGGITVSGGEPLLQTDFIIELFTKLKKYHIHTCLDTSGSIFNLVQFEKLIKVTDLFLLDIKHFEDSKYQSLTGSSISSVLQIGNYLSKNNIETILRIVVLPTINDSEDDIKNLKNIINEWKNISKIEFLPYHKLGREKWQVMNLDYPLENIKEATLEDIERVKQYLDN